MRSKSNFSAYVLIIVGAYLLLSKFDWIPDLGPILSEWWPAILIIVGVLMLVSRSSRGKDR